MRITQKDAEHVAEMMSGFSAPARVIILARLLDGPATVSELTAELHMGQTAVSNHLRVLRELDLAVGDREGRNVYYRLPDEHVHTIVQRILDHIQHG
ncbi:MAG: metalloregulator ArsR/SmtB family transcription factor [Ancrocorticia sp.]|nr:metalloregulator ArsR/SmtB family transcription factor [Ancrocorticia sp.]MCI1896722.1 metalloregulator ArsR/SmtB family transcription factor [Ancrocorticia sp.]MCI1933423.1 metalloregulator ArsR/SmtB family transcription factor [Ancrocorticia sp.]MCI1963576.1 metalloregulator ArsR/SmtB family transcription factor [Ancrocorticia sp.]MCI2002673.1 metalloregulator ArsR/SmtB family transcription factor [Ancrocorticia sp.]